MTDEPAKMQHVAYFDEGAFHWMSGIAPRDCELYAPWRSQTPEPVQPAESWAVENDLAMACLASLRAAIFLLEKGGKKAASSDKMFAQMLVDYHRAADNFAASLAVTTAQPAESPEAVAWSYRLATCIASDGTYSKFDESPRVSLAKPNVPEGSIRDLTPLFAATTARPTERGAVEDEAVRGALDALTWANERLRECGKQVSFSLGMCVTLSDSEKRAETLRAILAERYSV